MKKTYLIYALLGVLFLGNACSDDFGDTNVPSDAVTKVEPKLLFNSMVQEVFSNYQRNVNLFPDLYSQYWANNVDGFESGRYEYNDGWISNQWKEFYSRQLRNSIEIDQAYGEDPFYVDAIAIKEIWICYWWSRMTDAYGDIPYIDASIGEAIQYTRQEIIYSDLFARLDKAVKSITGGKEQYRYDDGYDLIYNDDVMQWQKFGNSLRLRLAMRISNVDAVKAKAEAIAAINGPGGLMTSNADGAKVPMWSQGWYDYIHQMAWNWNNSRMSETMSNYLYSESSVDEDPRASKWFTYQEIVDGEKFARTKEEVGKAKYFGVKNGYNILPANSNENFATINLEGGYIDFVGNGAEATMYCPVMNYAEVKFLEAEAALRGWTTGNVKDLYEAGIQASMDYVGVANADSDAYITGLNAIGDSNEAKLKHIITQKWLANFPNGVEGWADFRRTDYPDLSLPKDQSGNATVALGSWVKRIRYPNNEHQQNSMNMPSAQNTKDSDRMDIRLWWDTADTKTKSGGLMNSNF